MCNIDVARLYSEPTTALNPDLCSQVHIPGIPGRLDSAIRPLPDCGELTLRSYNHAKERVS